MDKNKRGSNYTEFETEMLLSLIQKFKHIIENKETNAVFAKLKQDTWQKIVDEYNAHAVTGPRNWQQVRHKYDNLKQKARKKVAKEIVNLPDYSPYSGIQDEPLELTSDSPRKRYYDAQEEHDKENDATNIKDIKKKAIDDKKGIFRTGGGSYRPSLSETESQVLALMAPQVNPLSNPYDDAAVYFGDAEVNMDTEIELLTSEETSFILAANNKDINNEMAMQENLSDAEISYNWEVPEKDPVIDQMVNKKTTDTSKQNKVKKNNKERKLSLKDKYFKIKLENAKLERKLLIHRDKREVNVYKAQMDSYKRKLNNRRVVHRKSQQ